MDKTLRSILWILVALVVLSSFSTGWFFVAKEKLYGDYVDLENLFKTSVERLNRQLASSQTENRELRIKLAAVEKDLKRQELSNKDLSSSYEALLRESDDLNKELARVRKGKFFLEKKIRDVESEMFVAGLLKDNVSLEVELKRLKDSVVPKDLNIEELKKEKIDLVARLSRMENDKNLLEQRVENSEEVAEILSRDLLREKDKNERDRYGFESAHLENKLLKDRVADLERSADKFDTLIAERDGMQMRVAELERNLDYKKREIEKMRLALEDKKEYRAEAYHAPGEVDLPPIVLDGSGYKVGNITDTFSASSFDVLNKKSGLKGRVVTVNKDHGFVVIDLGKQHGIEAGTAFKVYRGNIHISMLEVIQCRERISACDIKDTKEGFFIEIDDIVAKQ